MMDDQPLSERWLLESSQYQYGNAPIRRLLAVYAWLQLFVALCPAAVGPWAEQAVLSARRGSQQASASSALEYYFDPTIGRRERSAHLQH